MNILPALQRRAAQLNRGKAVQVIEAHAYPDGHGTYMLRSHDAIQQVFVNKVEASALARGRKNKNLDSQLRI